MNPLTVMGGEGPLAQLPVSSEVLTPLSGKEQADPNNNNDGNGELSSTSNPDVVSENSAEEASVLAPRRGDKYSLRPRSLQKRAETEQRGRAAAAAAAATGAKSRGRGESSSQRPKRKPPPLSKYRRKTANARERDRMREINAAFENLRRAVPHMVSARQQQQDNSEKLTKITTLRLAMRYITALSQALQQQEQLPQFPPPPPIATSNIHFPLQCLTPPDLSRHCLTPPDGNNHQPHLQDFTPQCLGSVDLTPPDLSRHCLTPPEYNRHCMTPSDFSHQCLTPPDLSLTPPDLSQHCLTPPDCLTPPNCLTPGDFGDHSLTAADFENALTPPEFSAHSLTPSDFGDPCLTPPGFSDHCSLTP